MNINIVGWGYTGIQLIKYLCRQQVQQNCSGNSVRYSTISEYEEPSEFGQDVAEFVVGCDAVCPNPMAADYVCNDIFRKNSGPGKLADTDMLIHLISLENTFSTGAVRAFSNFLLREYCGKSPFQIALVLLPSLEEGAETAGRFLIQMTAARHPCFDLVILLDREGPLFRKENLDVLDEYVHRFISLFTNLLPDSNLLHFLSKMDARFLSFSMTGTKTAMPDIFVEHLLKSLIEDHSTDLFDGEIRWPTGIQTIKAFPRVKKVREVFVISTPSGNYKEVETAYRKHIANVFVNADIFYLDFNGADLDENLRNQHILLLARPLTHKLLLIIRQYVEKYWGISPRQFEKMLVFENTGAPESLYETVGWREKKFVKNYLTNMGKPITDTDYLLTDYGVSRQTLETSLKLLSQWIQG